MKHPGKTPPFRGPHGEPVPGSIAEIKYLRVGGVDQWVMIRGEHVSNPPLILLHGGPGMSETSFFRHCMRRSKKASPSCTGINAAPASRSTETFPRPR